MRANNRQQLLALVCQLFALGISATAIIEALAQVAVEAALRDERNAELHLLNLVSAAYCVATTEVSLRQFDSSPVSGAIPRRETANKRSLCVARFRALIMPWSNDADEATAVVIDVIIGIARQDAQSAVERLLKVADTFRASYDAVRNTLYLEEGWDG